MIKNTENRASTEKRAFSVKELVEVTSISRAGIFRQISNGNLKAHKIGNRTVVFAADLDKWLSGDSVQAVQ